MVHGVVVDQRAAAAATGAKAFRQHADHGGEILAGQRAIGPSPAQQRIELVLVPFARGDLGDDLLGEHIERLFGDRQSVELAAPDAVEQRRAFDELVAGEREEAPLGQAIDRMPGTPDPLQETRDRMRRTELANQVDLADIDAEFERGGRHQRLQRAALEALFGVQPLFLGETAVMRRHLIFTEPLRKLACRPLGHATRVHEDQRGTMRCDQLGQSVIDLLPDVARHHGFERRGGNFEGEVARPVVAGVDDPACGRPVRHRRHRP